jgi:peptidoglycan/xylan/chitin deacetylase (PgdA/CDA1 family)
MKRALGWVSMIGALMVLAAGCAAQPTAGGELLAPLPTAASAVTALTIAPPPTASANLKPRPTELPIGSRPLPTPTSAAPKIVGYRPYRMREGDTIERLSARGGSTPALLRSYNRLEGDPQAGRELIVPQLSGKGTRIPYRGIMVLKGNTAQPWVGLTIDCGTTTNQLPLILDVLREAKAQATFFMVGGLIDDGAVLERMRAEGHELANHSFSHADFTGLSRAEIVSELEKTEQVVQRFGGPGATTRPYFRFPYGAYDLRVLREVIAQGYLPIHWTLDALDAVGEPKTPEFILERITSGLPPEELPGAIVLAHCTQATAKALPEVISRFKAMGLELRTLTDLLGP